jgi:hypothetical protein
MTIQGNSAPTVAAVQAGAPVAPISKHAEGPIAPVNADASVAPITPIQAGAPVAAVNADAPITAIPTVSDVFDERGAVLLNALAERSCRNRLATGRGASDQSRCERSYNEARLHRLSPFVVWLVRGDLLGKRTLIRGRTSVPGYATRPEGGAISSGDGEGWRKNRVLFGRKNL